MYKRKKTENEKRIVLYPKDRGRDKIINRKDRDKSRRWTIPYTRLISSDAQKHIRDNVLNRVVLDIKK